MKFDVVIGNPPYEKNMSSQFFTLGTDILKPNGYINMITSGTWLTNKQNTKTRAKLAKELNYKKITWYPLGAFHTYDDKPVLLATTSILAQKQKTTGKTLVLRKTYDGGQWDDVYLDQPKNGLNWIFPYSTYSVSIYEKIINCKYPKIKVKKCGKAIKSNPHRPNSTYVHFGMVQQSMYTDSDDRHTLSDRQFGRKLLCGMYDTPMTDKNLKYIRCYIECNYPQSIMFFLSSKVVGMFISMVHISKMPTIINDEIYLNLLPKFDIPNLTNDKIYQLLNLTDEEINWLENAKPKKRAG